MAEMEEGCRKMEKVVGEQGHALQQNFPYKSSKFPENSNCRINLLESQTWSFGYLRCARSISCILQVIAHNIYLKKF